MTPLLENILAQPSAWRAVAQHQSGAGRGALERAVQLLAGRKRLVISGMGASLFAGIGFSYAASERRSFVQVTEASELLYFLSSQLDADTTLLVISRSGESVEITKLLEIARSRKSVIVGVTNVPGSCLAQKADEAIVIASPPDEYVAVQTYTSTVATLALLDAACEGDLDNASGGLETLADRMQAWIPECVQNRGRWDDFLNAKGPLYLLGRGPGLGAVAEGVLLMHETAKAPAVGMSTAQFRHGPVEVVDATFRAIVIGAAKETAGLEAALADDLLAIGAEVRWLGPSIPGCKAPILCHWEAGVPDRFGGMLEVIALQVLAYRKAELSGVRPGQFRWAPLVTTTESGFAVSPQQP